MPRKQKIKRDQQVYKLPQYGATVTVDYDTSNPPPFYQPSPGVVVVGQFVTAVSSLPFDVPQAADRAELEAVRARLEGRSSEPVKPKILTPGDFVSREFDAAVQVAIGAAEPVSNEGIDA